MAGAGAGIGGYCSQGGAGVLETWSLRRATCQPALRSAVLCCGLLHRAVAGAGEQQMLLPQRLNARSEERLTAEMTELGQASLRNPA